MLLANGYHVRVLDNFETGHYRNVLFHKDFFEYRVGDIQNPKDCREALDGIETVFHLARPAFKTATPETFFENPAAMTQWGVLSYYILLNEKLA